ncbi:MAG: tRNA threonylcarbamoyladenosine biosynthesis protein TsaE [Patescibacteria group bacterium]|nr:tRNA threonylcarbamoyladenosine biosynthesis protein TsaE [Patescibacteria group bacterium]
MQKVLKTELPAFAKLVVEKIQSLLAAEALAGEADSNQRAFMLALKGDLGAGKTTFVQALGAELGVAATIQSPTYVIMKRYDISFGRFTSLVHIDAYRFEKPEEFAALKPEIFLSDTHTLVVIEWPERVEGVLPTPNLLLNFSADTAGEGERYIEIE